MKYLMIGLIKLYRKYLSPLKRQPTCRYYPTCSAYALEALQKRGLIVGTVLILWRLFRCQPCFPGGLDPVPERGLRNRYRPTPLTKYYYPEEYRLEKDPDGE